MVAVELQLGDEVVDVLLDQRRIPPHPVPAADAPDQASIQTLEPTRVLLCFPECDGVAFLQHFVHRLERFEGLDLVGHDGLDLDAIPEALAALVVPRVHDACSHMLALGRRLLD